MPRTHETDQTYLMARAGEHLTATSRKAAETASYLEPFWLLARQNNDLIAAVRGFVTDPNGGTVPTEGKFIRLPQRKTAVAYKVAEVGIVRLDEGSQVSEIAVIDVRKMSPKAFDFCVGNVQPDKLFDGELISAIDSFRLETYPVVHHGTDDNPQVHETIIGTALDKRNERFPLRYAISKWAGYYPLGLDSPADGYRWEVGVKLTDFEEAWHGVMRAAADPNFNPHLHQSAEQVS